MDISRQTPELLALYQEKHLKILHLFADCKSPEALYEKIIYLGKSLSKPSPQTLETMTEQNLIKGCQSVVYIFSKLDENGKIFFEIQSDALISSGLAALLLYMYQGEKPEFTLLCPPLFINDLKLNVTLSPGRSNGLASMYSRMKQDALKLLLETQGLSL